MAFDGPSAENDALLNAAAKVSAPPAKAEDVLPIVIETKPPVVLKPEHRLFGPDLVRAWAIVFVMLSHTLPGAHLNRFIYVSEYVFGYLGVEIFFVLSGYLIGGILLRDLLESRLDSLGGLVHFWKRRWFRTLPNYYLFLLVYFVWDHFRGNPTGGWNFLWFGQSLLKEHPVFFAHAWSLAIEEWFYLLFPFALWLTVKLLPSRRVAILLCVGIFMVVPVVLRACGLAGAWDAGMRKETFLRLDALMYGVGLAYIRSQKIALWQRLKRWWWLGAVGLVSLAIFWVLSGEPEPKNRFVQIFIFNATSVSLFLLLPGMLERPRPSRFSATAISKLSLWSYSIYLLHPLVIALVAMAMNHIVWPGRILKVSVFLCAVWVVTILISGLIYRCFEKPVMDLRDRNKG